MEAQASKFAATAQEQAAEAANIDAVMQVFNEEVKKMNNLWSNVYEGVTGMACGDDGANNETASDDDLGPFVSTYN